jgi:hypothetical protein
MTITYEETRDSEQLRLLRPSIDAFAYQGRRRVAKTSASTRQTLFFFPGGIASQLTRATKRFVAGVSTPQTFEYEPVWLAPDTFVGGARDLKMHRDAAGTFRDRGARIIVADAALGLDGETPHDGLIEWCADNNIDLFVFPWDWRRRLDETAGTFVRKFLPFFRARVLAVGHWDPLERFSLVGHSFGGMVVNLILRGNDPNVAGMRHVITVGTPFYGYAGQLHRWFEGEAYLNGTDPPDCFKLDLMETIASLPGLYTLHFLDEITYRNSATQSALATDDAAFLLPIYPSTDATSPGVPADAFYPKTNASLLRYPAMTGFDRCELEYARLQFQQLASPMDPGLLRKFYNIRGVLTEDDGQTPKRSTIGSVTWDWIPGEFDSSDPSPIVDGGLVPGDNTQPAWSARLAANDPSRCITIKSSTINHIYLMSHAQVLEAIGGIVCAPGAAVSPRDRPPPEPASDEEIVEFMRWLAGQRGAARRWRSFDDPEFRRAVPRKFRSQSKFAGIWSRILMDIMKRPAPKGLLEPEGPRRSGAVGRKGRTSPAKRKR